VSVDLKTVGLILLYVGLGLVGDLLLSRGMRRMPKLQGCTGPEVRRFFRHIGTTGIVVAGVACLAANFAMLLALLSFADVSLVVPSRACAYLFLTVLACKLLHEKVPPQRWAGTVLVSLGVALVLLTSGTETKREPPPQRAAAAVTR
jgi:drug/metabolite transporter (DMT)-like permease